MRRLRPFLARHAAAAAWLVACLVAVRMLVPAGYMPVPAPGGIVLGLCPGMSVAAPAAEMHHGGGEHREPVPAGEAMPCAFATPGLAVLELPAFPVAALAANLVVAVAPSVRRLALAASTRWRPPLRAPPFG